MGVAPSSWAAKTSGVVGVEHELLAVGVLGAEAGEVVHGGAAVGAVDPLGAGPPLEAGCLGCGGESLPPCRRGAPRR